MGEYIKVFIYKGKGYTFETFKKEQCGNNWKLAKSKMENLEEKYESGLILIDENSDEKILLVGKNSYTIEEYAKLKFHGNKEEALNQMNKRALEEGNGWLNTKEFLYNQEKEVLTKNSNSSKEVDNKNVANRIINFCGSKITVKQFADDYTNSNIKMAYNMIEKMIHQGKATWEKNSEKDILLELERLSMKNECEINEELDSCFFTLEQYLSMTPTVDIGVMFYVAYKYTQNDAILEKIISHVKQYEYSQNRLLFANTMVALSSELKLNIAQTLKLQDYIINIGSKIC